MLSLVYTCRQEQSSIGLPLRECVTSGRSVDSRNEVTSLVVVRFSVLGGVLLRYCLSVDLKIPRKYMKFYNTNKNFSKFL